EPRPQGQRVGPPDHFFPSALLFELGKLFEHLGDGGFAVRFVLRRCRNRFPLPQRKFLLRLEEKLLPYLLHGCCAVICSFREGLLRGLFLREQHTERSCTHARIRRIEKWREIDLRRECLRQAHSPCQCRSHTFLAAKRDVGEECVERLRCR